MDGFHGIVPQLQLMGGTTSAQAKEFIFNLISYENLTKYHF